MILATASASGKIILVGEYAVVFDYPGIALPSKQRVNILFTQSQKKGASTILWNDDTTNDQWREYAQNIANLIQKKTGVQGAYEITNEIPLGRGMGSSTALVIAMARASLGNECEAMAKEIEDEVNPGNSGLDFTVIWHEKPVLFQKGKTPRFIDLPVDLLKNATFIDTGARSEPTSTLVAWVRSRYPVAKTPGPGQSTTIFNAIEVIGHSADRILKGEPLKDIIKDHHRAQVALGVVPKEVGDMIAKIEESGESAKVLGAGGRKGGGGMVMDLR